MVLQAYIDDSYNAGGVFVLGGHIAPADIWAKFAKDWEELLPYGVRSKDGNHHFKMSEMAAIPERMDRVGAFYKLIEEHELISISCKIDIQNLLNAKKRLWVLGQRIDWTHLEDPFFFTFRALIDNLHDHREMFPSLPRNEQIEFIFDEQSQKRIILPAWNSFLQSRTPETLRLFGAPPRFENDRDFLPLQAADLWAWWTRQWYEDGCPMFETENGKTIVMRGNVSSKKIHRSIFISYDEERITKSYKSIFKLQFPSVVIYDDKYQGE